MFRHRNRSDRHNRLLAGYLAATGGFVNSAGFVLIGAFTSHVTGNVGRLASELAGGDGRGAAGALALVSAFFAGAFVASMMVESDFFGTRSNAYACALAVEALLLVLFMATVLPGAYSSPLAGASRRLVDLEAGLLCAAMGMQNSLVTRLSGAIVRTTHLTGVVTDLGIEAARWFRWWRGKLSGAIGVNLAFGRNPAERPSAAKTELLLTIAGSFAGGAVVGAVAAGFIRQWAMAIPSAALVVGAVYAFRNAAEAEGSIPPPKDSRA